MIEKLKRKISEELLIKRHGNGIRLARPQQKSFNEYTTQHHALTMHDTNHLPFNIFFNSLNSDFVHFNQPLSNILDIYTLPDQQVHSVRDVSPIALAQKVIANDTQVLRHQKLMIIEEAAQNKQGGLDNYISIKMPWYDETNTLIGIFGLSIKIGQQPIAESFAMIQSYGLMNQVNMPTAAQSNTTFTKRQQQIIACLIRGKTAREIGNILHLSTRTIEGYIDALKQKQNVSKKSELIETLLSTHNVDSDLHFVTYTD